MPRALRPDEAFAVHHITARGVEKRRIFLDDRDHQRFLNGLASVARWKAWRCLAYCLMSNHYHLIVQTTEANLGTGMRDLNGTYAMRFNRRHDRTGHLFQGRYHSVRVQSEAHLREAIRYVALNPVRAQLCRDPLGWRWSSHAATSGGTEPPPFLATEFVRALFAPAGADGYAEFVAAGQIKGLTL